MNTRTIKLTSLAILCGTALSVGAAPANAQFSGFGPATILTAEFLADKPSSVVIGDYDGDGKMDLAVTYAGSDTVAIFKNLGGGTFAQPPFLVNNVGDGAGSIVTGDLDGDGDLDLAADTNSFALGGNITVLRNDGAGVFAALTPVNVYDPQFVAIADLNADTKNDLVSATVYNWVSVRLGQNNPPTYGREFKVISGDGSNITIFVMASDLDGTGGLDLIIGNTEDDVAGPPSISVLKNASTSPLTYGTPVYHTLANVPKSGAVADMDGNFDLDFVMVDTADQIHTFMNNGSGGFSSSGPGPVGALTVMDVALGDLDGNGSPDAVVAFSGDATTNGGVAVLLNLTANAPGGSNLTGPLPSGDCVALPTTPTLTWTESTGFAITYKVRIATDPAFTQNLFEQAGLTSTSFDVPPSANLTKGTLYY